MFKLDSILPKTGLRSCARTLCARFTERGALAFALGIGSLLAFASNVEGQIIPPGPTFCNETRVLDFLNANFIPPGSHLAADLAALPPLPAFNKALNQMHPALFQDLTLSTNENMIVVRETFTGRSEFLRHTRCKKFPGLFNNACNIGISQLWMTPFGVSVDQAHRGCLQGYRQTSGGVVLGFDTQPNKCYVAGLGIGYSYTDLHWKKAYGKSTVETLYFGAYNTWMNDYFYIDAAVLGSIEWYVVQRNIRFRNRHAKNRHKGFAIDTHLGAGFRYNLCGIDFEPFASVDYDYVDQDGYRETGGKALNLRVKHNHAHLMRYEAGLALSSEIPYNCAIFRPSLAVSYVRKDILQGNKFESSFVHLQTVPGAPGSFTSVGTKQPLDFVAPSITFEVDFSNNYIFALTYNAELNRKQTTQSLSLRLERMY